MLAQLSQHVRLTRTERFPGACTGCGDSAEPVKCCCVSLSLLVRVNVVLCRCGAFSLEEGVLQCAVLD